MKLFKDIGVPLKLIIYGAMTQVMGNARKVCEEACCLLVEGESIHLHQTRLR